MNRMLKTLLIWLLMAVLPLNAVAAALGSSCSAMHEKSTPAATVAVAAAGAHDAHHGATHAQAETPAAASADQSHDATHSTCSACSAFCIGAAAPPPTITPSPSDTGSEIVLISPAPWIAGFIPDGHKRPPRQLSA